MATAEQIKALIKSHCEKNDERFSTTALQLAAHEAKQGHSALAHDIRVLIDNAKSSFRVISITKDFSDLMLVSEPRDRLAQIVMPADIKKRLARILEEYNNQNKIKQHGLSNRRKLLLAGPPGTGKTMTASVLAGELHIPLHTIMIHKLVTKFMGETSAKLRQIFDIIHQERAVYLFDEFDAIGAERSMDNDVGEIRRVLNSFLQFIEQDNSDSLIIAATNNPKILDQALYRRFDDVLHYDLPKEDEIKELISNKLANFRPSKITYKTIYKEAETLSHAEIVHACESAIKDCILSGKENVGQTLLVDMLRERRLAYKTHRG